MQRATLPRSPRDSSSRHPPEAIETHQVLRARQYRLLPLRRDVAVDASCAGDGRRKAPSRSHSIWQRPPATSIAQAVLVNSTAGHAFELDDIHKESIVHPGSLATPVALAYAEAAGGASGRDVITGMIAGYEVGTRVGNAATMSLFLRGFHPQGTSGAFVAAATAGRMVNLDAAQMQHALGIVGSQAGGLMAAQEGAMVKRFHCGRAAQSGVLFRDARETRFHRNHRMCLKRRTADI